MEQNNINPQSENNGEVPEIDKDVKHFLEQFAEYEGNPARLAKMSDITDDYEELEYYAQSGNTGNFYQMRNGAFYKVLRVYDIDAKDLPKVKPHDDRASVSTLSIVDSAKTQIWEDGGVNDVWDDVRHRFKAEGTVIVQIGFDKAGKGYTPLECCDLSECYFDASMQHLATDSRRLGKTIKIFIRAVKISWGEFINLYPEFADKVNEGSPAEEVITDTQNFELNSSFGKTDKGVTIHYAYSIADGENPVMCVYAGSNKVLLEKYTGKDYPFWIKRGTGEFAFLPFIDAHASNVRRGFYSPSVIGLMKDKTANLDRILRYSLPVFEKAVNPIMLLLGSKDEQLQEEMAIASEMQKLGQSYIIPTNENVSMQELKPQQNIFSDLEAARTVILRELSTCFGFNVQEQEVVEQTATEFIGKSKAELKAIAGVYKGNASFFEKMAEYAVALASKYWKTSDKRLIQFEDDAGEKNDLEMGIAIAELREFKGQFKVETDLKMPMSTADKRTANQTILAMINALLPAVPSMNEAAIDMQIEAIEFEASLSDLDHIYTKPKLSAMFKNQQAPLPETDLNVQNAPTANAGIAAEMSPNKILAEAGI